MITYTPPPPLRISRSCLPSHCYVRKKPHWLHHPKPPCLSTISSKCYFVSMLHVSLLLKVVKNHNVRYSLPESVISIPVLLYTKVAKKLSIKSLLPLTEWKKQLSFSFSAQKYPNSYNITLSVYYSYNTCKPLLLNKKFYKYDQQGHK